MQEISTFVILKATSTDRQTRRLRIFKIFAFIWCQMIHYRQMMFCRTSVMRGSQSVMTNVCGIINAWLKQQRRRRLWV